ncbi:hypothetical protein AOQ84DRAFT_310055 [Glonium stellatum]|uniref:Histone-lysine N-methyltransferase n=1 Tax=Glonium stellatum TaxID=574774 RepID=A0A8E2FAQ2_9PEZI|nr:hypothetical protein AOQ84DRAFT_310055 [Glonium stellatum]
MDDRAASPDSTSSTLSCITVATRLDTAARSSIGASSSNSTPPTSQDDSASIVSDATKAEAPAETQQDKPELEQDQDQNTRRTSRRSRSSISTYNVQILAGTAIHTPTKYLEKHTKNVMRQERAVSDSTLVNGSADTKGKLLDDSTEKLDSDWVDEAPTGPLDNGSEDRLKRRKSSRVDLLKEVTRNAMASASSNLGKRGREVLESGKDKLQALRKGTGSLRRRQSESTIRVEPAPKRAKLSTVSMSDLPTEAEKAQEIVRPKVKRWQTQGLYLGQHRDFDARFTESKNQKKRKSTALKENQVLPLPMFAGERLLSLPYKEARDFKLPFDVFSPLPRKAKPEDWKKTSKNLFVGDAATIWKKSKPQAESYCLCAPEEGCGESCQNRFMLYECDSTNCLISPEHCTNRAFAELKRRSKGNRYDYGVEVVETEDRGYGVRAMRTFNPHQIIVEYAGEIITQEECDRRMNNEYKNNKCYYLMTFHNKMIIDATRGSIARFVNHSCEPNCRMVKWTVAGEPRMALFAGDRGIMTGEELTYDYNFDPFSSKNVQECRCGTASCRGVLGPRSKDAPKAKAATALVAGAKRKIQEVFGSKGSRSKAAGPNKRRKVATIARSALAKAKKSVTESQGRDARAEKEAAETEARSASRAERAIRRSSSTITVASKRSKVLRKGSSASLSTVASKRTIVSVRQTTVSTARPGALRRPSTKLSRFTSAVKRHSSAIKSASRKSVLPAPSSPVSSKAAAKSATASTPTAASVKSKVSSSGLRQTTLPFKPLSLDLSTGSSSPLAPNDDDIDGNLREFAALPARAMKRPTTASSVRSAAASVKKNVVRSVRGPRRAAAVARMGLGLGVGGMGGLGEGGSGSTIRVILGEGDD